MQETSAQETTAGLPACPTCGGRSDQVSGEFEGFIEGYWLSVLECTRCTLRFSSRLDVPDGLYDNIYAHAAKMPGYSRYHRYASVVRRHPDPLALLASYELPYWFVRNHVQNKLAPDATVIDLGCGEGYLTYALRQAGVRCIGVDVSATAVDTARQRFGRESWFFTVDDLGRTRFAGADLVIALELVEHVPQPAELLRDAVALLKEGGTVLMTTPNRDARPPEAVWDSDLPPVHLHWFSPKSLTELAIQADCDVAFPAVPESVATAYNGEWPGAWPPVLTASGEPSQVVLRESSLPSRVRKRLARELTRVSGRLAATPVRRLPRIAGAGHRPYCLCATFTPRSIDAANGRRR